jgi:putative flippase GtrA
MVSGYFYFLIIAIAGLFITVGGSYTIVSALGINPLIARFLVGGVSGLFNFLINAIYNFRVS